MERGEQSKLEMGPDQGRPPPPGVGRAADEMVKPVVPPVEVALMVSGPEKPARAVIVKLALVAPAGSVTVLGTVTDKRLLLLLR